MMMENVTLSTHEYIMYFNALQILKVTHTRSDRNDAFIILVCRTRRKTAT